MVLAHSHAKYSNSLMETLFSDQIAYSLDGSVAAGVINMFYIHIPTLASRFALYASLRTWNIDVPDGGGL